MWNYLAMPRYLLLVSKFSNDETMSSPAVKIPLYSAYLLVSDSQLTLLIWYEFNPAHFDFLTICYLDGEAQNTEATQYFGTTWGLFYNSIMTQALDTIEWNKGV